MLVDINRVTVKNRIRKEFGNIDELAQDIKENGLINPPVVTPEMELIAGERRLRAMKHLGYQQVEVRVMKVNDYEHMLNLEINENESRKDFTKSERIQYARQLEQIERMKAKERQESGVVQNFAQGEESRTRDNVAKKLDIGSGEQYRKEKYIEENADEETLKKWDNEDISTHKAYVLIKEKAKQLEEENEQIKYRQEILLEENKELRSKPVEVRVEEKEVIPEHIKEKLLDLEEDKRELEKLKQAGMSVEEYEKRKREIEREVSEKSDEMASLIKRTREIQESYNKENNLNSKRGYLLSQIKASTEGLKARKTKIEQGFNALDSDVGEMLEATLEAEIGILNEVSDYFSEKLRISRATKIKGEIING